MDATSQIFVGLAGGRLAEDVLEDVFGPDNLVNPADYIGEPGYGYTFGPGQVSPWLSTRSDRQDGRNRPLFATENELASIRGSARILAGYNPNAIGVLGHLTNYTIGEGFTYKCLDRNGAFGELARRCQHIVDSFIERNDFVGDYDGELFLRGCRDGEYTFGIWHRGYGVVDARAIEPEQVTEPGAADEIDEWLDCDDRPHNWSFGIHTDADDTENVHGVYVQWSNNANDWDYLPAGKESYYAPGSQNAWVEHAKLNVDRKIKRGLSDFFCAGIPLESARKLLRNMGTGAALQAAIPWIVEAAPGVSQQQIVNLASGQSAGPYYQQTQFGTRVNQTNRYDPGTILYTPNGTIYKPPPMASAAAANFVIVYEVMLRSLAVRWQMPEHMVTGSAANNDYASILEAGSPFEKSVRRRQQFYVRSHKRIMWKVLEFACAAGVLGDVSFERLQQIIKIQIEPPRVSVRDRLKEVQADCMLWERGALSESTMSARDGLDYAEEQASGAGIHLVTRKVGPAGGQPVGDTADGQGGQPGQPGQLGQGGAVDGSEVDDEVLLQQ